MKTLFGAPKIEHVLSKNGAPVSGDWKEIQSPKDGTATLDSPDGTENELKNEKGKVIDSYTDPATSTITFELVKEKGKMLPFAAKNGPIPGEHAFRVTNDNDPTAPAFQLDRCTLTGRILWSKGDALRVAYTAKVLDPAEGEDVKVLGVDVDQESLSFSAAADSTGKVVKVEGNGTITATSDQSWATPTVSGDEVTVKVSANSGEGATTRTATITITDSTGFAAEVVVSQSAAA